MTRRGRHARAGIPRDQQGRTRLGRRHSPKVLWDVVRAAAARAGIDQLAPHDCGAPAPASATSRVANRIRSSSCSAMSPSKPPSAISDASRSSDRGERPTGNRTWCCRIRWRLTQAVARAGAFVRPGQLADRYLSSHHGILFRSQREPPTRRWQSIHTSCGAHSTQLTRRPPACAPQRDPCPTTAKVPCSADPDSIRDAAPFADGTRT